MYILQAYRSATRKLIGKIKYPKLILILLSIVLAYLLFTQKTSVFLHNLLIELDIIGMFLAGALYAYGFTAAPATALLLIMAREGEILVTGLFAGLGALASDLVIFLFIRHTIKDELKRLSKERIMCIIEKHTRQFRGYFILPLAGFLIASPLPTEIGVVLAASVKEVTLCKFMIAAYILHTVGIFAILLVGSAI